MIITDFAASINLMDFIVVSSRTIFIFLYAFVLLRILGRRKLAQLNYIDLLLIIAFGSAVGDVMIYDESIVRFWSSVIAITVVAVIVKILDEISAHSKIGNKILEGSPALLIKDGQIVDGVLEKENISMRKINSWLREKNIESISHIKKAFIESDGQISVVLNSDE